MSGGTGRGAANASPAPCRHCGRQGLSWRRRGVCWRCHGYADVRRIYPAAGPGGPAFARAADFRGTPLPPESPLPGRPGDSDRVAELRRRYERRVGLFDGRPGAVPVERVAALFGVG